MISAVMVSFHTGPALLESVAAVLADPDIGELILVDNGNPPAMCRQLAERFAAERRFRMLQGHGNVGFARACNYGAGFARGEAVLFLNPDAVIARGAAKSLLEAGRAAGGAWLAGGRLLDANGAEQRGSRRGPLTLGSLLGSIGPLHRLPGLSSIDRNTELLPDAAVPMPTVSGAFMMLSRAALERTGGFDPGYFLHVEDIALCRSVRQAGGSVIFVPNARVVHYGSTSDAPTVAVEAHKLRGFLRYFLTGRPVERVAIIALAPALAGAILGRAWLRSRKGPG